MILARLADTFFEIIILILVITILLSWFPNIKWYQEPFKSMRAFCEVILSPFRNLLPPINGIDFSPIIAFIVIGIARQLIIRIFLIIGI